MIVGSYLKFFYHSNGLFDISFQLNFASKVNIRQTYFTIRNQKQLCYLLQKVKKNHI